MGHRIEYIRSLNRGNSSRYPFTYWARRKTYPVFPHAYRPGAEIVGEDAPPDVKIAMALVARNTNPSSAHRLLWRGVQES